MLYSQVLSSFAFQIKIVFFFQPVTKLRYCCVFNCFIALLCSLILVLWFWRYWMTRKQMWLCCWLHVMALWYFPDCLLSVSKWRLKGYLWFSYCHWTLCYSERCLILFLNDYEQKPSEHARSSSCSFHYSVFNSI